MLTGTADLESLAAGAPTLTSLDAGPVEYQKAEILQALFEQPYASRQTNLPPGLHPTTPPLLVILAWKTPSFCMAQARVSCRSGVRPRGFVAGCVVDCQAGVGELTPWGLPAQLGEVDLTRRYDGVDLRVSRQGRVALALTGLDPDPLSPGDAQFTVTTTLAHTPRGLRLVQVEPEYQLERVERVKLRLDHFDAGAWGGPGAAGLEPVYPISATISVGTITIPKLRFLSRPDVLAFVGTEKV
jgi:hypothetical protein